MSLKKGRFIFESASKMLLPAATILIFCAFGKIRSLPIYLCKSVLNNQEFEFLLQKTNLMSASRSYTLYVSVRTLTKQVSVNTSASLRLPRGIIARKYPCENGSGMLYLFFTLICMKESLSLQTGICSTLPSTLRSHSGV